MSNIHGANDGFAARVMNTVLHGIWQIIKFTLGLALALVVASTLFPLISRYRRHSITWIGVPYWFVPALLAAAILAAIPGDMVAFVMLVVPAYYLVYYASGYEKMTSLIAYGFINPHHLDIRGWSWAWTMNTSAPTSFESGGDFVRYCRWRRGMGVTPTPEEDDRWTMMLGWALAIAKTARNFDAVEKECKERRELNYSQYDWCDDEYYGPTPAESLFDEWRAEHGNLPTPELVPTAIQAMVAAEAQLDAARKLTPPPLPAAETAPEPEPAPWYVAGGNASLN